MCIIQSNFTHITKVVIKLLLQTLKLIFPISSCPIFTISQHSNLFLCLFTCNPYFVLFYDLSRWVWTPTYGNGKPCLYLVASCVVYLHVITPQNVATAWFWWIDLLGPITWIQLIWPKYWLNHSIPTVFNNTFP